MTITSGNASTPASWDRALELIDQRQVDPGALLSEAVPLEEWEQAFAATRSGAGIKYLLVPWSTLVPQLARTSAPQA